MHRFIPVFALFVSLAAAHADEGLDLRAKIVDYSKSVQPKRWHIEDELTHRERLFQDGLMQEYRDTITKGLQQLKDQGDWKQAQRAYRELVRNEVRELRQKVRLHREEFELTYLASANEMEKDLKEFLAPFEDEFKKNKSEAYQKAQSDFDSSRDNLKEELSSWKERLKNLKTPSDLFSGY